MENATDENWQVLASLLPAGWDRMAFGAGAVERLRGFSSTEALLRTLLLHVGRGYSLRETAVQAHIAKLTSISDVTVLNRLRQAEPWLHRLCHELLADNGIRLRVPPPGRNVRALDGTVVEEPGRTGSSWRVHYSLQLPSLLCDYFEITSTSGTGTGEGLQRFPARPGDLILVDRGFSKPGGIEDVVRQGADIIVRVNTSSLPLRNSDDTPFPLLERLCGLDVAGQIGGWQASVPSQDRRVSGRVCAIRKTETAAREAQQKVRRKAMKRGAEPKPETLEYAAYVILFTTVPEAEFAPAEVLDWYRLRWQIELVFKRLKTVAQLGHLPKHTDESSRAWLYGKLLVALLTQKLVHVGRAISPWGYLDRPLAVERLARV